MLGQMLGRAEALRLDQASDLSQRHRNAAVINQKLFVNANEAPIRPPSPTKLGDWGQVKRHTRVYKQLLSSTISLTLYKKSV
jgi:hypothetical protein